MAKGAGAIIVIDGVRYQLWSPAAPSGWWAVVDGTQQSVRLVESRIKHGPNKGKRVWRTA